MNKVTLIGRTTKEIELKYAKSGLGISTFILAVDRRVSKEKNKETDFIQCKAFGKLAENIANYVSKGNLIGVSGRIQTGSYEAKDGVKRYTTEIIADEVQFLEKQNKSDIMKNDDSYNLPKQPDITPCDDSDIPF